MVAYPSIKATRILVVDDERDIRIMLASILTDEGCKVDQAEDEKETFAALETTPADVILLDIWLKEQRLGGMAILEQLRLAYREIPVIMMSGHSTIETAVEAVKKGAYDFIEKPFRADSLLLTIRRALESRSLRHEVSRLRLSSAIALAGRSKSMRLLAAGIEKIAPTSSRVLIHGPGGVGKEFFARQIHAGSPRSVNLFYPLRCATLSVDTFEGIMFGDADASGVLDMTAGGTLYLDDISDLDHDTQSKMIPILREDGEGNGKSIRFIASTHYPIDKVISQGGLREDLFFQLNVMPMVIPPLSERREDIPLLVAKLMDGAALAEGLHKRSISPDAMAMLQNYDWPGNIRELRNIIDRLLIMSPGDGRSPVTSGMLPPEITGRQRQGLDTSAWVDLSMRQAREIFEREYLLMQMERCHNNIAKMAKHIGMERTALHRKLKVLGLSSRHSDMGE